MSDIPVIVMRNKSNPDRYLAANIDVGDWEDENLDVKLDNIQNAYMIIRKDLAVPSAEDYEAHKNAEIAHKNRLREKFGEHYFLSLDFEEVCEHYEPISIVITQEQYKYVVEMMEE